MNCTNCGKEVNQGIKFCPSCGFKIQNSSVIKDSREIKLKNNQKNNVLEKVSAGVIIIIIAITYIRNPFSLSVITRYFGDMVSKSTILKPPIILLDFAIFFFYSVGIWGIILSVLRVIFVKNVRQAMGDLINGFFPIFMAILITNYAEDIIRPRTTLAYFIVGIGIIVILNVIIQYLNSKERVT